MLFQTFLLWNIKEGILKTAGNKAVLVSIDFHCINKNVCINFKQKMIVKLFFYVP